MMMITIITSISTVEKRKSKLVRYTVTRTLEFKKMIIRSRARFQTILPTQKQDLIGFLKEEKIPYP